MAEKEGWKHYKRHGETFGFDQCYYLDCDDCFIGEHISENIKLYTLNMFSLLQVNYTSIMYLRI